MFWPWLIFIDFLIITLLSGASSILFGRALLLLYRLSAEKHMRMAPSFIAFMGEMTLLSLALSINGFIMLVNWHRDGYNSAELVFWSGVLGGCLIPAVPVGVLFLSIDRLIILGCPPQVYGQFVKRMLGVLSVGIVLLLTLLHFYFNLQNEIYNRETQCWTFACFSSEFSISIYAIDRFLVAVPNFIASIALLLMLLKQQRSSQNSQQITVVTGSEHSQNPITTVNYSRRRRWRTADKIALYTAILLFTFDLVPSTANLIATYAFDTNLSTVIGPYRQMTGAMNALGCALIYWRYFERKWRERKQISPTQFSHSGLPN